MSDVIFTKIQSPVGELLLVGSSSGSSGSASFALRGVYFADKQHAIEKVPDDAIENAKPFRNVITQLQKYFAGELDRFDLPLAAQGTTFQRDVWRALSKIPYGTTTTYAEIARAIGRPKAVRAVGAANGKNPISIIVPCHRVIGANETLTGYAGGLPNKKTLLELEKRASSS